MILEFYAGEEKPPRLGTIGGGPYRVARLRQKGMIGRRYLEKGRPVTVLKKWGPGGGPRNVLIEREDGTKVVRPFRGLRRSK